MAKRKISRRVLGLAVLLVIGGLLAAAFWPRPVLVDLGAVTRGPMELRVTEEGRTRVRDSYVVSAPVEGRLSRVAVEPGDEVDRGVTVVARMSPINPVAYDLRTREQAIANVNAAEAALHLAESERRAAEAALELADAERDRMERLAEQGNVSEQALQRAVTEARAAAARLETALATIAMREAELGNARAQLIGFDGVTGDLRESATDREDDIPLYAPIDGVVLQVFEPSETTLGPGAPILEIGNIRRDLEIEAELLSADAVQVSAGDPVVIDDWGGPPLDGHVRRIEPFGVTKVSALGVEEQRVRVHVAFDDPEVPRGSLAHGYRVEVNIVVWRGEDVLQVPTAALFRDGDGWAVFVARDGRAALRAVEVGRMNEDVAEVTAGLAEGDRVVLYPSAGLQDGVRIAERQASG